MTDIQAAILPAQRRIVFATSICTVAAAAPPFLVGVIVFQVREDFTFTAIHLALVVAGYFAVSALVSPLSRPLIHRIGSRGCLAFSTLVAASAMVVLALAWDWRVVLAAELIAGIGNSVVQPAVSQLISGSITPRYRGLALGLNQSAIPLATLIVAMMIPSLALTVGWRSCAWLLAGLSLVVITLIPSRRDLGADQGVLTAISRSSPRPEVPSGSASIGFDRIVLFALAGMFASMAATNIPAFLTLSAVQSGMSQSEAALVQVAGSVICIGVRVLSGWLGDGSKPDYLLAVALMLLFGAAGYVCISTDRPMLVALGAVLAFGFGWGWSGLFNLSVLLRFPHDVAGATVITQAGVYSGAMIGPLVFGVILHSSGLSASWWMVASCALVAALLVLVARTVRPLAR